MTCLNEQQSSHVLTTMASIGSQYTEQLNVNIKSRAQKLFKMKLLPEQLLHSKEATLL